MNRHESGIDYRQLYDEFRSAKVESVSLTLKTWCARRELNYTGISRNFAPYKKDEAKTVLESLAPLAVAELARLLKCADPAIRMRAALAILDRAGLSPAAVNINVVPESFLAQVPPLFEASCADKIREF